MCVQCFRSLGWKLETICSICPVRVCVGSWVLFAVRLTFGSREEIYMKTRRVKETKIGGGSHIW